MTWSLKLMGGEAVTPLTVTATAGSPPAALTGRVGVPLPSAGTRPGGPTAGAGPPARRQPTTSAVEERVRGLDLGPPGQHDGETIGLGHRVGGALHQFVRLHPEQAGEQSHRTLARRVDVGLQMRHGDA